jgi:hypothetical protein
MLFAGWLVGWMQEQLLVGPADWAIADIQNLPVTLPTQIVTRMKLLARTPAGRPVEISASRRKVVKMSGEKQLGWSLNSVEKV